MNRKDSALQRCPWCEGNKLYEKYHDEEWGVPVTDDLKLFEMLLLETFQAGLSWLTVLKKRENFRKAFADFDYRKVADFGESQVEALMKNDGIIRNRLKIKAAISNASAFMKIKEEFGSFSKYMWSYTDGKVVQNSWVTIEEVPAQTTLSDKLSKDLKKRGFKFVGSIVIYAHLQACGVVNDHLTSCFRHQQLQ